MKALRFWGAAASVLLAGLATALFGAAGRIRDAGDQGSSTTATSAAAARTAWDKVFSEAQSKRGQATYVRECAPCHGEDLRGSGPAPSLAPDDFLFVWENQTVADLLDRIRTRMPPDRPDSLGPDVYGDVVAFLLSANGFPAGEKELAADVAALRQIRITAKPEGGK